FAQRRRDPERAGHWIYNLDGVPSQPYRLHEIKDAGLVYIVEGEKDADALVKWGFTATTNSGGAGKWQARFAHYFAGKSIVILPDNDPQGEAHATHVAASLASVASAVRIVRLPDLPPK